jgi:hypothetical protein
MNDKLFRKGQITQYGELTIFYDKKEDVEFILIRHNKDEWLPRGLKTFCEKQAVKDTEEFFEYLKSAHGFTEKDLEDAQAEVDRLLEDYGKGCAGEMLSIAVYENVPRLMGDDQDLMKDTEGWGMVTHPVYHYADNALGENALRRMKELVIKGMPDPEEFDDLSRLLMPDQKDRYGEWLDKYLQVEKQFKEVRRM